MKSKNIQCECMYQEKGRDKCECVFVVPELFFREQAKIETERRADVNHLGCKSWPNCDEGGCCPND